MLNNFKLNRVFHETMLVHLISWLSTLSNPSATDNSISSPKMNLLKNKQFLSVNLWILVLFLLNSFLSINPLNCQPPVAMMDSDRSSLCLSNSVTFADSSSNNPTSWMWQFPGGSPNISNVQNPVVTYNAEGSFDVTLIVTNASGSDTVTNLDFIQIELCRLTNGVYRIPYGNNTDVFVSNDHITHSDGQPEYDLIGTNGSAPYPIVAARDGFIRIIVDNFSTTNPPGTNPCNNNYVWMEHEDGEWSKYTLFVQNTVTLPPPNGAGMVVDSFVTAGTYLGDEDAVGCILAFTYTLKSVCRMMLPIRLTGEVL